MDREKGGARRVEFPSPRLTLFTGDAIFRVTPQESPSPSREDRFSHRIARPGSISGRGAGLPCRSGGGMPPATTSILATSNSPRGHRCRRLAITRRGWGGGINPSPETHPIESWLLSSVLAVPGDGMRRLQRRLALGEPAARSHGGPTGDRDSFLAAAALRRSRLPHTHRPCAGQEWAPQSRLAHGLAARRGMCSLLMRWHPVLHGITVCCVRVGMGRPARQGPGTPWPPRRRHGALRRCGSAAPTLGPRRARGTRQKA